MSAQPPAVPVPTMRPTLIVQTVCFDDGDLEPARELGIRLYELLGRPRHDRLAYGAGVPVYSATSAGRVDVRAAGFVVLVPVVGTVAFQMKRQAIVKQINAWHEGGGPGRVLPVFLSNSWRNIEWELKCHPIHSALRSESESGSAISDEVLLAIARLLRSEDCKPRLFISHAKADLSKTGRVAQKINQHVTRESTGQAFYDASCLLPGDSVHEQLDNAIRGGVFVAVRSDSYSSRDWCQRELLAAKRQGLPTLTVEVIQRGDPRLSAYGGNGPSVLWEGDAAGVASRAMAEWVRAQFFQREAERISTAARLPKPKIMTRPPELLDIAVGSLQTDGVQIVMHPDPPLSVSEREILSLSAPRLTPVTPTTAYRFLRGDRESSDTPLDGMQVSMSLSDSPDVDGEDGFTKENLDDAVVYIARCLISAGAAIAYGGDFRNNGYTELLYQIIAAHKQADRSDAEFLHSYLAATVEMKDAPVTAHHLLYSEVESDLSVLPPPEAGRDDRVPFYFSDMRRVMSLAVDASVMLGGQTRPRSGNGDQGYGGRYPGVVEEAWRMLAAGKPLYVCGGFGGAAGLVAQVLEAPEIPQALSDQTWMKSAHFAERAVAMDADEFADKLDYPGGMDDLARAIHQLAGRLLATDSDALAWNGLTIEENQVLFKSRDPVTLSALIFKGLLTVHRKSVEGKLHIELNRASVTQAKNLDAISVPVCDNIPVGGAGGALDRELGGLLSVGGNAQDALIGIESKHLAIDWLHLANLGTSLDDESLNSAVERAASEAADAVRRYGFRRFGVVLYGGTVRNKVEEIAGRMLNEFQALAGTTTLVWFEADHGRFKALKTFLGKRDNVHLTTQVSVIKRPPAAEVETLLMQVRLDGDQLETTVLPPAGTAVAGTRRITLTADSLKALTEGGGVDGRSTPDFDVLAERGPLLADILLGGAANDLLSQRDGAEILIVHNLAASKLPFELLATENTRIPATNAGLSRRLIVEGSRAGTLLAKPPKAAPLEVLLVVDPRSDLEGARAEGAAVQSVLETLEGQDHVVFKVLWEEKATKSAVIEALQSADVLHYCGHAFFEGSGMHQSGLVLADGNLTLESLIDIKTLPRVAFVNACEAGRVRGKAEDTKAAAFAEFFLRGGIEAYLGTNWYVGDKAAEQFAKDVYQGLARAESLSDTVRKARKNLHGDGFKDWANYILYGEGRFRLVAQ